MSIRAIPTTDREAWRTVQIDGTCRHKPQMTLKQVGEVPGISQERARQIEARALLTLRQVWDAYEENGWPVGYRACDFGIEEAA